jgi:hypothetical protein
VALNKKGDVLAINSASVATVSRSRQAAVQGLVAVQGSKFNVSRTAVFVFRNRVSFFIFRVLVFQP